MEDNKGKEINMDNIDDIVDVEGTQAPEKIWNDGEQLDKVYDSAGNDITPAPEPELDAEGNPIIKDVEKELTPEEKIEFEKANDDLVNKDEEGTGDAEFFTGLAGLLSDRGLISEGDDPITNEEEFVARYEAEINSRLGDRAKAIEEYMSAGVSFSTISKIERAMSDTNAITEEQVRGDDDLAQNLVISEFKNRGFDDATAARYYEMFKTSGKHVEEAMSALNLRKANLNTMRDEELQRASSEKDNARTRAEEDANSIVKAIESGEILNRKVTAPTQAKLKRALQTVVGYTSSGEPMNAVMKYKHENPVEFEKNLLYLYTVTDGFSNLNALDRSAETRISKQFRDSVSNISSGKSFTEKSSTPNRTLIDMDTIDDIV